MSFQRTHKQNYKIPNKQFDTKFTVKYHLNLCRTHFLHFWDDVSSRSSMELNVEIQFI